MWTENKPEMPGETTHFTFDIKNFAPIVLLGKREQVVFCEHTKWTSNI